MEVGRRNVHPLHMRKARKPAWRRTFLREWREAADKTLEEVAEKMGITHGQLSKIERGLSPYSQRILEIAATEYGCTVQDLLTRRPEEGEGVFGLWERLTPEQRRRAERVIHALKDDDAG